MSQDAALDEVVNAVRDADPGGERAAKVFRATYDQLYDGQNTGRFSPTQLAKTEKTHFGSMLEIGLRREFDGVLSDGTELDYAISGHEVDCKFSFTFGAWMIPPEGVDALLMVCHASDEDGLWSLGIVRASEDRLSSGENRDRKRTLVAAARQHIEWVQLNAELAPNVLLHLSESVRNSIMSRKSGQARVNELFRRVQLTRIPRATIATVAQQLDPMKRVRADGGARSALRSEGFLLPGGDYSAHRAIALALGAPDPAPGEFVSFRVVPVSRDTPQSVELDGRYWRIANAKELVTEPAPSLPSTR